MFTRKFTFYDPFLKYSFLSADLVVLLMVSLSPNPKYLHCWFSSSDLFSLSWYFSSSFFSIEVDLVCSSTVRYFVFIEFLYFSSSLYFIEFVFGIRYFVFIEFVFSSSHYYYFCCCYYYYCYYYYCYYYYCYYYHYFFVFKVLIFFDKLKYINTSNTKDTK